MKIVQDYEDDIDTLFPVKSRAPISSGASMIWLHKYNLLQKSFTPT